MIWGLFLAWVKMFLCDCVKWLGGEGMVFSVNHHVWTGSGSYQFHCPVGIFSAAVGKKMTGMWIEQFIILWCQGLSLELFTTPALSLHGKMYRYRGNVTFLSHFVHAMWRALLGLHLFNVSSRMWHLHPSSQHYPSHFMMPVVHWKSYGIWV